MLTKVEVRDIYTNALKLTFDIADAASSYIQARDIDGLDPVKASINTTPYGSQVGEAFSGASVGKRNIVFTLGLNPDWQQDTPESLRDLLYTYLMPSSLTRLAFYKDTHVDAFWIEGYVESVESKMFSKDSEVQVSIICPDPIFYKLVEIEWSAIIESPAVEFLIEYEGTAPSPIMVEIESTAELSSFEGEVILSNQWNDGPTESFRVNPVLIDATHKFQLITTSGSRSIKSGADSVLAAVDNVFDDWIQLYPGVNAFKVFAGDPGQEWTLKYSPRYGGL